MSEPRICPICERPVFAGQIACNEVIPGGPQIVWSEPTDPKIIRDRSIPIGRVIRPIARLRRFFHCLIWTFTLQDHRMETLYLMINEVGGRKRRTAILGCKCGKVW